MFKNKMQSSYKVKCILNNKNYYKTKDYYHHHHHYCFQQYGLYYATLTLLNKLLYM